MPTFILGNLIVSIKYKILNGEIFVIFMESFLLLHRLLPGCL